jgi:hypothetical protein
VHVDGEIYHTPTHSTEDSPISNNNNNNNADEEKEDLHRENREKSEGKAKQNAT